MRVYTVHSVPHSATLSSSQAVVTGLLGVPASQVAMGRSHTCVLTQHGTVFTFGNNTYGQCGRNFVPPKEDVGGICTVHRRLCIIHRLLTVVSPLRMRKQLICINAVDDRPGDGQKEKEKRKIQWHKKYKR